MEAVVQSQSLKCLPSRFAMLFMAVFISLLVGCGASPSNSMKLLTEPSDTSLNEGEALIVLRLNVPIRNAQVVFQINSDFYYSDPLRQDHLIIRRVPAGTLRISHLVFSADGKAMKFNVSPVTLKSQTVNYLGSYWFDINEESNSVQIKQYHHMAKDLKISESVFPKTFSSATITDNTPSFGVSDYRQGIDRLPAGILKPDIDHATIIVFRGASHPSKQLEFRVDDIEQGKISSNEYLVFHALGGATVFSASLEDDDRPRHNYTQTIEPGEYYVYRWERDELSEGIRRVSAEEFLRVIKLKN